MEAAGVTPEYRERRQMPGRCDCCGDRPGWVEFVFGPDVVAQPGMELKGEKLEGEFLRLWAEQLQSRGWQIGKEGAEGCPGCREAGALREAQLSRAFARRLWKLASDTPDLSVVAELLNAEPTVDEQALNLEAQVTAERAGVTVEELHAFHRQMQEEMMAFFHQGAEQGLLTRMEMIFERPDPGPWTPASLQSLLLSEYEELPAGLELLVEADIP